MFASPHGSFTPAESIRELVDIDRRESIATLVVGWPDPDGEEEHIHRSLKAWLGRVRHELGDLEIIYVDEAFSSREAEQLLRDSGVGRKKRRERGRVDQAAAAIILQRYLDGQYPEGE